MTDIRVKIDELSPYDDVNTDKSRKNLYEVSKNTGTYSSPVYATNGSRKITQEQLREELNIKEYLVNEVIGKTNGDTLEVDKINVLNLTSNATFTLPTASIDYKGKALIIIQSNVNNYKAVINGAAQGPITISDFRDVIIFNCVFNETSSYDWFAISKYDSKICNRLVVISSSTYTANANDNIQANAQSLGSDIDITIPAAGIEGRLIYVYYPSGSPSAYVVNLIGGFSATLAQLDYFLIRDNGSYWEAISTSQNVSTTPDLDAVTTEGNTTTNSIEVGGLVVDMPSGSGSAASITKGGAGEALTVSKTSGSGNVASFTGGVTSLQDAEITSATANRPAFFDSAKKLVIATGALLGTWFQTFTAKSTPIGADTIIVNDSASSFEAKKTTLTELWTNYLRPLFLGGGTLTGSLNYAPSVTLASAINVNIGSANSNNIIITGTTTINTFDTVTEGITKVLKFTGSLILHVPNLPNDNIIVTQNGDYCTVRSNGATWDFINYQRKNELITKNFTGNVTYTEEPVNIGGNIQKQSVALVAPFDNNYIRPIFVTRKNATTSGRTIMRFMGTQTNDVNGIWIQHNDMARTPNGSFNIMNCESSSSSVLIGVGADVNSATQTLQVFQGGVAISSSAFGSTATINDSAQLHSQATNKGSLAINVLTTVQRLAITSPATGLQVFDSNLLTLCTFNGGSNIEANWKKYSATSLTGTYTPNTGIAGTTRTTVTVTVTGAVVGQKVVANINDAMRADFVTAGSWFLDIQAYVSATDTVTITFVLSTFTTFGATSSITVNVN
jgi:hypothetical protein